MEKWEKEAEVKEGEKIDLWQVTYTWQENIPADTEADAIAIAKNHRSTYMYRNCTERYSARRAEYIFPQEKERGRK